MSKPLAVETFTAGDPDAVLAAAAGVHESAIEAFRAGAPSWRLDLPGAVTAVAEATGTNPAEIRAAIRAAKGRSYGLRNHGTAGPATFPGQIYPSLR